MTYFSWFLYWAMAIMSENLIELTKEERKAWNEDRVVYIHIHTHTNRQTDRDRERGREGQRDKKVEKERGRNTQRDIERHTQDIYYINTQYNCQTTY